MSALQEESPNSRNLSGKLSPSFPLMTKRTIGRAHSPRSSFQGAEVIDAAANERGVAGRRRRCRHNHFALGNNHLHRRHRHLADETGRSVGNCFGHGTVLRLSEGRIPLPSRGPRVALRGDARSLGVNKSILMRGWREKYSNLCDAACHGHGALCIMDGGRGVLSAASDDGQVLCRGGSGGLK